jgi:hypothetical protein
VQVESYPVDLDELNAAAIAAGHELILDCTPDAAAAAALEHTEVAVLRLSRAHASATEAGAALAGEALRVLAHAPAGALT